MPYNHLYVLLNLFPEKPWSWYWISKNPGTTWEIVQAHPDWPWDWKGLSENRNITCEIIQENLNRPWDWRRVSINPNIAWDFILQHLDKPWRWCSLSYHRNITLDIILENPDYPWDWDSVSRQNPNITWDVISTNLYLPWDWKSLALNKTITWDVISKNFCRIPDKMIVLAKWRTERDCFSHRSKSDIPKYKNVLPEHYNQELNWTYVSIYAPLTWQIIGQRQDKPWNWSFLASNRFVRHNAAIKIQRLWKQHRRYLRSQAVTKISRWWKPIYYRPDGPHYLKVHLRFREHFYHKILRNLYPYSRMSISRENGDPQIST